MDWSLPLDPPNKVNSDFLKKNLKALGKGYKTKIRKGKKYYRQDGNYIKYVFQARLKKLDGNFSINAAMM